MNELPFACYTKNRPRIFAAIAGLLLLVSDVAGHGQTAGIAQKPYLGWSSSSQQSISANFLTQANIQAQSDALHSAGLEPHGFLYINIDSGWQGSFDTNGRPLPDTSRFQDISALISHIHANGQLAGITWTPGVPRDAIASNPQVLNTANNLKDILAVPYVAGNTVSSDSGNGSGTSATSTSQSQTSMVLLSTGCVSTTGCVASVTTSSLPNYKIDFTKPGAQEYVASIVALFASWGVDFIRLDGVGPSTSDESVDNQPDVEAWGKAITENGRSMWLTISSSLDQDYLPTWQRFANARRIGGSLECKGNCSTVTNWPLSVQKLYDLVSWESTADPTTGWNDLGPLEVGNTGTGGLNPVEQQSMFTFWAISNAPIYLGGDLTALDRVGQQLLNNDEVLAVDQSGHPATQISGGMTPVWAANNEDGSFYVALFNLNAFPTSVSVQWNALGFLSAPNVRDLWAHADLGSFDQKFTTVVLGHGVRLLRVQAKGVADLEFPQVYEAESGLTHGEASPITCKPCSASNKVTQIGQGVENTVTLNVYAEKAGTYRMELSPVASGPRDLIFLTNDEAPESVKVGGGSSNQPSSTVLPVHLKNGNNSIQFGNAAGLAPDLDRISIIGNSFPAPTSPTSYEAESAALAGTETSSYCPLCSGGAKVSSIDQSDDSAVTFPNVTVTTAGLYELEVDYVTGGQHSVLLTINGGKEIELDLNGSSATMPSSTVVPIFLKAGRNNLHFTSHDIGAPALDRIAVAPAVGAESLTTSVVSQTGPKNDRVWTLDIANSTDQPAFEAQVNVVALTQSSGRTTCQPRVLETLPLAAGTVPKHGHLSLPVHLDFSKCSDDAQFNSLLVYSSNYGAIVGDSIGASVQP